MCVGPDEDLFLGDQRVTHDPPLGGEQLRECDSSGQNAPLCPQIVFHIAPTDAAGARDLARFSRRPPARLRFPGIGPGQDLVLGEPRVWLVVWSAVLVDETVERAAAREAAVADRHRRGHGEPGVAGRFEDRSGLPVGPFAGSREEGARPGEDLIGGSDRASCRPVQVVCLAFALKRSSQAILWVAEIGRSWHSGDECGYIDRPRTTCA